MGKQWRLTALDLEVVRHLSKETDLPPLVAQLLARRDMTDPEVIREFIQPKLTDLRPPEDLPGAKKAAKVLVNAIKEQKPIVVFGDYDADGMNATAILFGCLQRLGAQVSYFVPSRLEDGYGLSVETIQRLADRGKKVIVSVDCGITSCEEAELCQQLGLQLVVTDHHQFGDQLPDAAAIVHPALPGHDYPFHGLCGAAVAFKLAWQTSKIAEEAEANGVRVNSSMREFLLQSISLAAIATIADVVPLVDENRILVKHGLHLLHAKPSIGLTALMKVCKLSEKSSLTAEDIGFTLAPRLNAAGRLGQAQLAVELLSTNDPERAESLAVYINKLNDDRMKLERSIQLAANKQAKEQDSNGAPAIVVAGAGWHVGVIGVVAGRLSEKYHKPSIVIALDATGQKPGTGSARSPKYANLHQLLGECSELLERYGGHAAAAGLRLREQNLPAFRQAFCETVESSIKDQTTEEIIQIDVEAALGQLDVATIRELEKLAPFGSGNRRPVFLASAVDLVGEPRKMGSNERHFSAQFFQQGANLRAVAFGQADWVDELMSAEGPFDLVFRPTINDFRGFAKVELQLIDWRRSTEVIREQDLTRVSESL